MIALAIRAPLHYDPSQQFPFAFSERTDFLRFFAEHRQVLHFRGRTLRLAALGLLLCLYSAVPAEAAEKATLTDIVVTNTRDHLLLYLTISDCFTEEMIKAIDSGINTTFTFLVRLYEIRNLFLDRKIADRKISHDIQFDSLKQVYTVQLSEGEGKRITVKNFEEAKALMSELVGLKVTELANLKKGKRYQLRMMAELDKIRLPLHLHYVLFFLSLWDFETDWYSLDFRY